MRIPIPSKKFLPTVLFAVASLSAAYSQTTWDFGGTPDKNWSTLTNWSTDASPAATNVVFGNLGTTGSGTSIGNIVDSSYTGGNALTSLTYSNTGVAAWQVTQIAATQTLTVTGSFRGGATYAGTGTTTLAAMTGSGTFVVNAPSSSFTVASSAVSGITSRANFDMSNLSSFSANVSSFNIGTGNSGFGTLYLADSSVITTSAFNSGGSGASYGSGVSNLLYFGTTTQMNVDTLAFGGIRTFGTAQFRPAASGAANTSAVTNGLLTLRGSASGTTAVATMTIGAFNGSMPSNGFSVFNLTAGTVDALVTNLTIGSSASALTNSVGGVLSMASGTFIATNVTLGQSTTNNGSTGTISGTVNVSGGSFVAGTMTLGNNGAGAANTRASVGGLNVSGSGAVTVTGNLVMGVRSGVGAVTSTVTVSAGTLLIQGDMSEGAGGANITSSVNLSGGTLNMDNGNLSVDNFTFTGGTLKNVASFVAATTGGLAMQNSTLGFDNINSISSAALSLTGTLSLTGSTNLSLSLANGFNPGASTILMVSNDGTGDGIIGTFATINGSGLSTFTLTNDQGSFQYQLSYIGGDGNDLVAISVPEPASCVLLGVGATMLLWRLRRAQKS